MTGVAGAQQPEAPPGAPAAPSITPVFSPQPAWIGSFTPSTITLSAPMDVQLPPNVRSREAWGAAPPVQPFVPQTPKAVSLHHTGALWNGNPGPEQYLRNIQHFHTGPQREWEDIAYHYLVDLDGVIWAGRPPTVRGNPSIYYDPTGLVLISFLGDYSIQEPTDTQLASVAGTAAWLMKRYSMASTTVTGHRDHAPTTCPGDNLYRLLKDGSFAGRVQDALKKLV
ncbi:MAG: peptidoglycan recognition family protein [Chloroflexota bacterium]